MSKAKSRKRAEKHKTSKSDPRELLREDGCVPIPKNIFQKKKGNVFEDKIEERHAFEQFFWTRKTVDELMKACKYVYEEKTCCMTTPSMAHAWHEVGREEVLLDIDKRFSYLPKFKYYDCRKPEALEDDFRLLILDPPFFILPIPVFREAVDVITKKNYDTKILLGFLKRGEKELRKEFELYNLVPTNFPLQYSSIKENKWNNFALYSNIDLPGIKRKNEKKENKTFHKFYY